MNDAARSPRREWRTVILLVGTLFGILAAIGGMVWQRSFLGLGAGTREAGPGIVRLSSAETAVASTAIWPFLRGPNYDGHSSEGNLADTWPSEGPPVLWTRKLGQGYSAFVARGERVYTQYQTLAGQFVVCLDAETGATIWEYRYDWPYEAAGVYPGPRSTPSLDSKFIYFTTPTGLVGCLSDTGKLIWSVDFLKKFQGRGADFGYSCSPVVEQDRVLIPAGGLGAAMVALDARDGTTIWQSGDDSASYTPALPISVDGNRQVIGYLENVLAAFDFETGRLLWRLELSQGYDEHAAWPVYVEPYLWISGPFRSGSQLLKLTGGENASAEAVWHSTLLSNDVCSSVHHDGFLYGFDLKDVQAKTHRPSRGYFRCLDLATGRERWGVDQTGQSSVIVADDKLILFSDRGELILARANPERYDELARTSVFRGEISWTPPCLHRGRIYLRTHSQAACLYIGQADQLTVDSALTVADIPQHSEFRWESLLGVEPEYAFDLPSLRWFWNWFVAGLAILGVAAVVAQLIDKVSIWFGRRRMADANWRTFWTMTFLIGAAATTPLSIWRGEFVFTWPVSLFVVFQATTHQVRLRRNTLDGGGSRWQELFVVFLFLAVCVAYFLLCRRLSLVFEWGFLCGFLAAVPFALIERWLSWSGRQTWFVPVLFTPLAFAAYYWASVAILLWRYGASS